MPHFINYNGDFKNATDPLVTASNRGLKYGDGLFETMKLHNDMLSFSTYHFERLFNGLQLLRFETPSWMNASFFEAQISALAKKNRISADAKVRLMIFRGDGPIGDVDPTLNFIIETTVLQQNNLSTDSAGLVVDVYPHARKSIDRFSSLKTNNFLPYSMAAMYAREHQLDDCIILNANARICDSTIANIFLVSANTIVTPSLEEGCISGIMRRWLIEKLPSIGLKVIEQEVTVEDAENADEIFLTNAVRGVMFVQQFGRKRYDRSSTELIRNAFLKELA
jgi:branched-chain amino acid aminotransferase